MKDIRCQSCDETIERYLSGNVTKEEADLLEAHLAVCPRCQQAVANAKALDAHLTAMMETPPKTLLNGVMADVRKQKMARRASRILLRVMPMAACLMLVVSVILLFPGVLSHNENFDSPIYGGMSGGMNDEMVGTEDNDAPLLPAPGDKEDNMEGEPSPEVSLDDEIETDAAPEEAPTPPAEGDGDISDEDQDDVSDTASNEGEVSTTVAGSITSPETEETKREPSADVVDSQEQEDPSSPMETMAPSEDREDALHPNLNGSTADGNHHITDAEAMKMPSLKTVIGILMAVAAMGLIGFSLFLFLKAKRRQ